MSSALIRWIGPLAGLAGAAGLALLTLQPLGSRNLISWWILERALSFDKALPLIGFGAALAPLSRSLSLLGIIAFFLGSLLGFEIQNWFVAVMAFAPDAADHLFLTGPISLIAAGLLLIAPSRAASWLVLPVGVAIGAMLAIVIVLTDPTIGSRQVSVAGVALGLWTIAVTALNGRTFYRSWFPIALRIFGSWLLAIGLLYGSASLVRRPALPSPPDEKLQEPATRKSEYLFPRMDEQNSGAARHALPIDP